MYKPSGFSLPPVAVAPDAAPPPLPRPVDQPEYWRERLASSSDLRRAVWVADNLTWDQMEAWHRLELAKVVTPDASVLDCGCGYGRLLDLMPPGWRGGYLGVDVSPDLVALARAKHPGRRFIVGDMGKGLRRLLGADHYDLAVCIMVRHMMVNHLGMDRWSAVKAEIERVADRLLILEPQEVL